MGYRFHQAVCRVKMADLNYSVLLIILAIKIVRIDYQEVREYMTYHP